jgi:hypothetical protein
VTSDLPLIYGGAKADPDSEPPADPAPDAEKAAQLARATALRPRHVVV